MLTVLGLSLAVAGLLTSVVAFFRTRKGHGKAGMRLVAIAMMIVVIGMMFVTLGNDS